MKKLLTLFTLIFIIHSLNAQSLRNTSQLFDEIHLGAAYSTGTGQGATVLFEANLPEEGIGLFTLGLHLNHRERTIAGGDESQTFFGGRISYSPYLDLVENLELYGGVSLGTGNHTIENSPNYTGPREAKDESGFDWSVFAGARYFFLNRFSVFTEVSNRTGYFSVGLRYQTK